MKPDQPSHFSTEQQRADLKARAVRGGVITVVSQGLKFVLQFLSTVVLARLLTPQDFGLVSMVTVVTGFSMIIKDLGLSTAIVQQKEITHEQVSALFWVNGFLSFSIMLAVMAAAPLIAQFYGEPRLTWLTIVIAIGFLFGGMSVQHQALLRRQMRFGALAMAEVVSMLIGVVTGISAGHAGAGYWALAFYQLIMGFSYMVIVWMACSWRPGRWRQGTGVRMMLKFGGHLTGYEIMGYISANLDSLLIGKYCGAQPVGYYNRARMLLLLPMQQVGTPIRAVAIPALSRLSGDSLGYQRAFGAIFQKLLLVVIPVVTFMIGVADWLVALILGPQWTPVVPIFSTLGFVAYSQVLAEAALWVFISQGRGETLLRWSMLNTTLAALAIIGGLPWGPSGVATSYAVSGILIRTPLLLWMAGRLKVLQTKDYYKLAMPFFLAGTAEFVVLWLYRRWFAPQYSLGALLRAFGLSSMIYTIVLLVLPSGRRAFLDACQLMKTFLNPFQRLSGST